MTERDYSTSTVDGAAAYAAGLNEQDYYPEDDYGPEFEPQCPQCGSNNIHDMQYCMDCGFGGE